MEKINKTKETITMQQFYETKKIAAKPMTRGEYNDYRGWELSEDENPKDAGYLVEYLDGGIPNDARHNGYISWTPSESFNKAYQPTTSMSFGHAIVAVKSGHRIARAGWNGAGQYVYYVPANSYAAQTDSAKAEFGDMVPYRAYLALKTAQNDIATWAPSTSDVLAEDWCIVE